MKFDGASLANVAFPVLSPKATLQHRHVLIPVDWFVSCDEARANLPYHSLLIIKGHQITSLYLVGAFEFSDSWRGSTGERYGYLRSEANSIFGRGT